jgi:hypothetical protein
LSWNCSANDDAYLVGANALDLVGTSELASLGDGVNAKGSKGVAKILGHVGGKLLSVLGNSSTIVLHIADSDTEAL